MKYVINMLNMSKNYWKENEINRQQRIMKNSTVPVDPAWNLFYNLFNQVYTWNACDNVMQVDKKPCINSYTLKQSLIFDDHWIVKNYKE